jgi:hypothetical protein
MNWLASSEISRIKIVVLVFIAILFTEAGTPKCIVQIRRRNGTWPDCSRSEFDVWRIDRWS